MLCSWRDLQPGLKACGLTPPEPAVGDGTLGFRAALRDVHPETGEQRCRVCNTANATGAMSQYLHDGAKSNLHDNRMAETRKEADAAFDLVAEIHGVNCEQAAEKLARNRHELLCFHDFPCEHWKHVPTAIPDESDFSTVRN